MIEIKHPRIDKTLSLDQKHLYNIVLENPVFLREFMFQLANQIAEDEEYLLYYKNDKESSLAKDAMFFDSPLFIKVDEKKLNTLVQKIISSSINLKSNEEYQLLLQKINEYILSINYDYPLPLTFDQDLPLSAFLKAVSLSIDESREDGDFLEKLIFDIRKFSVLFKVKIIFIFNLHDFFKEDEMIKFIEEMKLLDITIIFLSSHLPNYRLKDEFVIQIDKDLAEIYIGQED